MISPGVFFIFSKFWFSGLLGGKRAKTLHISGTIHYNNVCFLRYEARQIEFFVIILCPLTPIATQKSKFWKNEKSAWRYHHFTQVYQKPWSYTILFLRYGTWQINYFSFWAIPGMPLIVHGELFLLQVMLIGSRMFTISRSFNQRIDWNWRSKKGIHWSHQLDLGLTSSIEEDWASFVNKELLQVFSRNSFHMKGKEKEKNIFSDYITDKDGICNAKELINDKIIDRHNLKCIEEDADSQIVLHIAKAGKKDFKQFLVLSNDNNVIMYNLGYFYVFKTINVNKNFGEI